MSAVRWARLLAQRATIAVTVALAAGCSGDAGHVDAPTVVPAPVTLQQAISSMQAIDAGLPAWPARISELVDYSGQGGELKVWMDGNTLRKAEASLFGASGQSHWQVYYDSSENPFYAVYGELRNATSAATIDDDAQETFVLLKDEVFHRAGDDEFAMVIPGQSLKPAPDVVRAFGSQLARAAHGR